MTCGAQKEHCCLFTCHMFHATSGSFQLGTPLACLPFLLCCSVLALAAGGKVSAPGVRIAGVLQATSRTPGGNLRTILLALQPPRRLRPKLLDALRPGLLRHRLCQRSFTMLEHECTPCSKQPAEQTMTRIHIILHFIWSALLEEHFEHFL